MAEVRKLLRIIQKDLTEVKEDLNKTVKEEKLENIVTYIIKKFIAEYKQRQRKGLRGVSKPKCRTVARRS